MKIKKYVSVALMYGLLCTSTLVLGNALGDISLEFCNEGLDRSTKSLSLQVNENEENPICMKITNSSREKRSIVVGFVDGTITNDADQKKACKNEGENQNFGQFVDRTSEPFEIPGNSSIVRNASLMFPAGYAGSIPGCVTYYIADTTQDTSSMFKIVVRKANFIDVFVSGTIVAGLEFIDIHTATQDEYKKKNLSNTNTILAYIDPYTQQLHIEYGLYNYGSVKQQFTVQGTITNPFGYTYTFTDTERMVTPKESVKIQKILENIPMYKGPFTITLDVIHQGKFNFESDAIDPTLEATHTISTQTDIFVMPRRIIYLLGLLIVLGAIIRIILKSHTKKIINTDTSTENSSKNKKSLSKTGKKEKAKETSKNTQEQKKSRPTKSVTTTTTKKNGTTRTADNKKTAIKKTQEKKKTKK